MGRTFRRLTAAAALLGCVIAVPGASGGTSAGWVPTLPVAQQSWQMTSAFGNGTGYVFDRGGNAMTLWHSGNYGVSWDPLTYLPAGVDTFLSIRFASPKVGYAVDGNLWLRTENGATTADAWTPMRRPPLPAGHEMFGDSLGVAGNTVAVGGQTYGPLHEGCNEPVGQSIWTSHDRGDSWVEAKLPKHTSVLSISYLGRRLGVAVAYNLTDDPDDTLGPCTLLGRNNSVYVTRDGGRHFTRAFNCSRQEGQRCWSAAYFTASTIVAGRNDGSLVISRDGGRTFRSSGTLQGPLGHTGTDNDEAFWVQGLDFVGQVGYATTKLAGAFRTTDLGRTWTREPSCDSAFSLGIGEVAAFDATRAIAGGPTCVATRVSAPTDIPAVRTEPSAGTQFDVIQRGAGRTTLIRDGILYVAR